MAKPELNTDNIYQQIYALPEGNISEFEFARIKREIEKIKVHDSLAATDLMAALYSYKGDYPNAIKFHKKAIAKAPSLAGLYNNYGVTLRKAKKPIQAQKQFLEALSYGITPEYIGKALMISLELYDMKTFYELKNQYTSIFDKVTMMQTVQFKFEELETLMQKTSTSKAELTLFSERIMEFFKRYQVEPVNSHVTEDPEGGLFFSYTLAMSQDEMLALDEHYIDFLMEKDASVMDVGAVFWRV